MLLYLLVLGAAGYALYNYGWKKASSGMDAPPDTARFEASAPKQTIDNARAAARQIEQDAQQRADDMLDKTK